MSRETLHQWAAALSILLFAGWPGGVRANTDIHDTAANLTALASRLEALRQEEGIAAVGFAITDRRRTLIAETLGWADLAAERPATPTTRFRIGSITKTFTGVGLLTLVESGKVELSAPVTTYLSPPPFDNPYRNEAPVRVDHLMEHTAGFSDISREEFAFNEPLTPLATVLERFRANHRVRWRPGRHSSYSNLGPGIAGRIMEIAAGESFETYMTRAVLEPLAMTSSSWHLDTATATHLATGYDKDGTTPIPYWHMAYRPFGAINTTPQDMARFIRLLLNRGRAGSARLLKAESVSRLETPETTLAAAAGVRYGYGLGNYQWFRSGIKFHGHGGDGDGYLAHYGYAPKAGLGYFVVITAFKGRSLRRLRRVLEDFVTARAPVPNLEAAEPRRGGQDLERWVGEYVAVTARFGRAQRTLAIRQRGLRLETRRGTAAWLPLLPTAADGQFRRPDQPEATVAIVATAEGDIIYQGDEGNFAKRGPGSRLKSKEGASRDDY